MNYLMILFGKMATMAGWSLVVLAALGRIEAPFRMVILGFGTMVFLVHLLEIAYLATRHQQQMKSPLRDGLSVLVFGVFALIPLINNQNELR